MGEQGIFDSDNQLPGLLAAAHEIKAPLTIISHLAAILDDPALDLTESDKQVAVKRIQLSAERSLRLVRGLTASYRLSEQQLAFELSLEPVHLNQLCEEAAHEIAPFLEHQKQKLELTLTRKSPLVVAHRELLHDVFFNLLDNAVRHTKPGTVITLQTTRSGAGAQTVIHDNGPGIALKEFKQLEQRLGSHPQPFRERSLTGGLGLTIAQTLTAAMGGRLGLNRPKQGAEFVVELLQSHQLKLL